jgi:hypothetical protein
LHPYVGVQQQSTLSFLHRLTITSAGLGQDGEILGAARLALAA